MSETITINDRKFVKAKEAAGVVGYTADYITKLARESEIEAERLGRQWYVSLESLKKFTIQADRRKELRKQVLQSERTQERLLIANRRQTKVSKQELQKGRSVAATMALAILLTSVSLSVAIDQLYSKSSGEVSAAAKSVFDQSIAQVFSGGLLAQTDADKPPHNETDAAIGAKNESALDAPDQQFGLLLVEASTSLSALAEIEEVLSDEVEVEFESDRSGVITPVFKTGKAENESYRFLLVPVNSGG